MSDTAPLPAPWGGRRRGLDPRRRDAKDAAQFNQKFGLRSSDADFDRRMDLNGDGVINMADMVILTGYIEDDGSSQGGRGSGDSGD